MNSLILCRQFPPGLWASHLAGHRTTQEVSLREMTLITSVISHPPFSCNLLPCAATLPRPISALAMHWHSLIDLRMATGYFHSKFRVITGCRCHLETLAGHATPLVTLLLLPSRSLPCSCLPKHCHFCQAAATQIEILTCNYHCIPIEISASLHKGVITLIIYNRTCTTVVLHHCHGRHIMFISYIMMT